MENRGLFRLILISVLISLTFHNCSTHNSSTPSPQEQRMDSILNIYQDSAYYDPFKTKEIYKKYQTQFADSVCIYNFILAQGYCDQIAGMNDSALATNNRVLDFCQRMNRPDAPHSDVDRITLEASCWNLRAVLMQLSNEKGSAIVAYSMALSTMYRSEERKNIIEIFINMADVYRQAGKLTESAEAYRKALLTADSIGQKKSVFNIYTGIAQTYTDLNNFDEANYYFDLALEEFETRLPTDKYFYSNCRGNCFYFQKRYTEALEWFRKSYEIVRPYRQPAFNAPLEINIGEIMILTDQLDSAHYYLNSALNSCKESGVNDDARDFYLNSLLASLALKENNLSSAEKYLSRHFEPSRIGAQYVYLHNKRLMEFYQKKQDFRQAFLYQEKVKQYDDSLRNVKNLLNISEISSRYAQDTTLLRKDILLAAGRHRESQLQNISISAVLLLVLCILVALYIISNIRKRNKAKYQKQIEELTRLRMENVRNRISPHSVFNVLNAVMPKFRQYDELTAPLNLLIQVIRVNLNLSEKIAVSLGEELNLVKDYVELRTVTNPETPTVKWDISEEVDQQTLIPSMIIQIPLENALKYAFLKSENQENIINVRISQKEGSLSIDIQDNGSGYNPGEFANTSRGTGQGLKILFKTIAVLNVHNSEKIYFNITDKAHSDPQSHGTAVSAIVPRLFKYSI